jgi:hypothetical protein
LTIRNPSGGAAAPGGGGGASGWTVVHDDDFSTDRINTAEYTSLTDKAGLTVEDGSLKALDATANDKELYVPGVELTDNWKMMLKFRRPVTPVTRGLIGIGKRVAGAVNRTVIFQQVIASDMNTYRYLDWGTGAQLQGTGSPDTQNNLRDWWFVLRLGKLTQPGADATKAQVTLAFETWDEDPRLGWQPGGVGAGSGPWPMQVQYAVLKGQTFKDEIVASVGHPFLRIAGYNGVNFDGVTDWTIEDFIVATPDNIDADRVGF